MGAATAQIAKDVRVYCKSFFQPFLYMTCICFEKGLAFVVYWGGVLFGYDTCVLLLLIEA